MSFRLYNVYVHLQWWIRSGWKPFTTIKDVLKAKVDKNLHNNLLNSTILVAMLYAREMWVTLKKEDQYCCERKSEGWDCRIQKMQVLLGQIYCKIHRQQVNLHSHQVVYERLKKTNWKTSMKLSSNLGQYGEEGLNQE